MDESNREDFEPLRNRSIIAVLLLIIGICSSIMYIIFTSHWLTKQNSDYQFWANQLRTPDNANYQRIKSSVKEKVKLYVDLIEDDFLLDGMVVGKDLIGNPLDTCDSLLFSSIYYVSLIKLGMHNRATKLWKSIEASQTGGQWRRHPRCIHPTSRDMVVGILAAFSQNPANTKQHIANILDYISANSGFIGTGRPDVSFLTPGVAEFVRVMATKNDLHEKIPTYVRYAFVTSEFSALSTPQGYRAHLVAMQIWIELELSQSSQDRNNITFRTALQPLSKLTSVLGTSPVDHRIAWIAQKLYAQDPSNLFFKYLRLKSANALSKQTIGLLMSELQAMKQFPDNRLPEDCDRKADYLWQRSSDEYYERSTNCNRTFSGTDYVWMASILLVEGETIRSKAAARTEKSQNF